MSLHLIHLPYHYFSKIKNLPYFYSPHLRKQPQMMMIMHQNKMIEIQSCSFIKQQKCTIKNIHIIRLMRVICSSYSLTLMMDCSLIRDWLISLEFILKIPLQLFIYQNIGIIQSINMIINTK